VSQPQALIFEVSNSSFPVAVIQNSHKLPVLVEFMGVWSEHCIKLEDQLAALAKEFPEQFIFAKVDLDEQPELREAYKITNVPTIKVFHNGAVVRTKEGVMEEGELRALLKEFGIVNEADDLRIQAREKHIAGDTPAAIGLLTRAIQLDPRNTRIAQDMVQVFLDIGETEQAKSLFARLPKTDQESEQGRALNGQLTFRELAAKTAGKLNLQDQLATNPEDHDARFDLAVCLVAEHDYQHAMDNLFTILNNAPDYKDGAARELIISLTNMLAPNDPQLAQEFRKRLSNLLA